MAGFKLRGMVAVGLLALLAGCTLRSTRPLIATTEVPETPVEGVYRPMMAMSASDAHTTSPAR